MTQRKIVQAGSISTKDSTGAYLPKHLSEEPKKAIEPDPNPNDINLDNLIGKHMVLLYRETRSLMEQSSKGKLHKDDAHCMRENMKLLFELKKKEKELLETLTDEEIKQLVHDQTQKS